MKKYPNSGAHSIHPLFQGDLYVPRYRRTRIQSPQYTYDYLTFRWYCIDGDSCNAVQFWWFTPGPVVENNPMFRQFLLKSSCWYGYGSDHMFELLCTSRFVLCLVLLHLRVSISTFATLFIPHRTLSLNPEYEQHYKDKKKSELFRFIYNIL